MLKMSLMLLIFLSALGVYMGRYGRWNSWDIFTNPLEIIRQVLFMIFHVGSFPGFYGMTMTISIFLILIYYAFDRAKLGSQFMRKDML